MDDVSTSQDRNIVGASGLDEASALQPPLNPNDLPMIVWLRGDEAYLDDFCLDAEAAMKALGIKRSRLTQISGRELRVGRLRVDRYTRPVYRIEDIETYKSWTRATASHLRASSVIQEAATKLEEQSKDLSDQLKHMFIDQIEHLQQEVTALKEEVINQRSVYATEAQRAVDASQQSFLGCISQNYDDIRLKFDALQTEVTGLRSNHKLVDEGLKRQAVLSADVNHLTAALAELTAAYQTQHQAQLEAQEAQAQFNRDLGKALSIVLQFQRESIKKNDEAIASTKELMTEIKAQQQAEPAAAPEVEVEERPKRKMPYGLRRRMARRMT